MRLSGVLSGLSGAIAYALNVVIVSGPLVKVDSHSVAGLSGITGAILSPCLWLLKDHFFETYETNATYVIAMVIGT